jgi:glutamate mutase epsilon subunit
MFKKEYLRTAALKPIRRRCVVCAWAGEVRRGILRCPDCNSAFKVPLGPYKVTAGKNIPAGELIDAIEFCDGGALVVTFAE